MSYLWYHSNIITRNYDFGFCIKPLYIETFYHQYFYNNFINNFIVCAACDCLFFNIAIDGGFGYTPIFWRYEFYKFDSVSILSQNYFILSLHVVLFPWRCDQCFDRSLLCYVSYGRFLNIKWVLRTFVYAGSCVFVCSGHRFPCSFVRAKKRVPLFCRECSWENVTRLKFSCPRDKQL